MRKTLNSKATLFPLCRRHLPANVVFWRLLKADTSHLFLALIQAALTEHTGYFLPWLKLRALLSEGIANVGTLMLSHAAFPPLFIHPRPLIPNLRLRQPLTLPSSLNKWWHQNTPAFPWWSLHSHYIFCADVLSSIVFDSADSCLFILVNKLNGDTFVDDLNKGAFATSSMPLFTIAPCKTIICHMHSHSFI